MTINKPNKTPYLSILLPVYNVEPYIAECLESIIAEAADDEIEIVVVDDGSADGSLAVVEQVANRSGKAIRVERHAVNQGVGSTRNSLLAAARGEYVWFIDPDDKVAKSAISRAREILRTQNPDLIICDFSTQNDGRLGSHGRPRTQRRSAMAGAGGCFEGQAQEVVSRLMLKGKLYVWNKIFRRSLLESGLRFPQRYFEDMDFCIGLVLAAQRIRYVKQPWIVYRHRQGSFVSFFGEQKLSDWCTELRGLRQRLDAIRQPTQALMYSSSFYLVSGYLNVLINAHLRKADAARLNAICDEMSANSFVPVRSLVAKLMLSGELLSGLKLWRKSREVRRLLAQDAAALNQLACL